MTMLQVGIDVDDMMTMLQVGIDVDDMMTMLQVGMMTHVVGRY